MIRFKKHEMQVLINLNNKLNIIILLYIAKLGLKFALLISKLRKLIALFSKH